MHTSKVVRIVMIAMIVLPLLSGLASSNTPVASASTGFSWNVTRNDFVGDCSQGPWFVNRSTLNFGGHVENNATFTAKVRSAAYHSDTAGCAPTTDAPAPFNFSGSGLYAPGDSGDFMFSFNPASYNCGRVQLDGLFIDNTTHEAIDGIYGVILNYGVNCNGSQPTPTPSQNPTPTPAPTRTPTPNPIPSITPQPGNLSAVCVAGPAVQLAWGNGVNQNSNSLQRMTGTPASGGSWAFIYQDPTLNVRSYTDSNISANTTYSYRIKYGANVASNVVTVNCPGSTPTPTPVPTTPTPTPGQTSPGTLTGLCVSGKVVLNWTSGVNANSNGLEKGDSFPNDPNQFWAFVQPQPGFNDRSYTDANITPGVAYSYRVKYAPGVPSNIVTVTCPIPATPTPSPTPLSSVSPAPTPTPGQCILGTVVVNSNNVSAPYTVVGPNGSVTVTGNNTFTNQATGNYSISINGNNNVVVAPTTNILACNSTIIFNIIVNGTPTPVPSLTPNPSPNSLAISKLGKDLTEGQTTEQVSLNVRRSDTLEFDIHVRAGNTSATNVIVSDRLPAGIIYLSHTSTLNGIAVNDGVANGGINIGTLSAGQEAVVSFRALVDISAFPAGVTRIFNSADIRADNIPTMTVQLPIELSSIGIISQVKTGPTDTLWMAMAVSALATLVYFRYTGTVLFKRREVLALVREQSKDRSRLNFANVR